ncbi:MAG TPA: glycosyltransferase [Syntrophobacteraceae bacterium]|nr:glycosyltransferase [Syntrophobacteraceae bacterium]
MDPSLMILLVLLTASAVVFLCARRWKTLARREVRVLLTGGGTGGHVNPALAIAEDIKKRDPCAKFLYVGVRGKAESVIVRRAGYPLWFVFSEGFPGLKPSFRCVRFLFKLGLGVVQSVAYLLIFAPRWVIATGGYVSAPVILAALILRTLRVSPAKVFLHEQNSIPGQLNGLLGRYVDRVLLTFPQTLSFFPRNGVVTGYPIRKSIAVKPRQEALESLPFRIPDGKRVVFAFGGSQGARTINRAVVDSLPHLLPHGREIFIIHGTGLARSADYDAAADTLDRIEKTLTPEQKNSLAQCYYRQDYFHNIADIYSVCDLIVCRSGAGSLNEISCVGKPAVLIPKANLPGDHQVMNARTMKHCGAAVILFEDTVVEAGRILEKLEGRVLAECILQLLKDPSTLEQMARNSRSFLRQQANDRILNEIYGKNQAVASSELDLVKVPFRPLLSNQQLLQTLSAAYRRAPDQYHPLSVIGDENDLHYYQHRASGLLSHEAWQDRNVGVKLTGLTLHREKIPTLLHMLTDRTPVHWVKRILGGDFEQVGFIRRNIIQAIQVMGHFDAEVEQALLTAMEDPYYEVRSQACAALARFGSYGSGKEEWFQALVKRLNEPCFEVVVQAAEALGEIGTNSRALEILLRLREHHYWQVRDAALKGVKRLLERGTITPSPHLSSELLGFILTATDFRPHFSIKQTYKSVRDLLNSEP